MLKTFFAALFFAAFITSSALSADKTASDKHPPKTLLEFFSGNKKDNIKSKPVKKNQRQKEANKLPSNCGGASWYALHSRTASGERMNPSTMTAAHRSLKFGTRLRVVNRSNSKAVIVRINDRGPFSRGRVLDLSRAAAHQIGMISTGVAKICYEVVS